VEEVRLTKERLGWPTEVEFFIPDEVREWMRSLGAQGAARQAEWEAMFARYAEAYPQEAATLRQAMSGKLPADWDADLKFNWAAGQALATRAASGQVLNAIAPRLPTLIGGSAHLPAWRPASLWWHVPGLFRLHAPGDPHGCSDAFTGDFRLHPR
jgi:transketolase